MFDNKIERFFSLGSDFVNRRRFHRLEDQFMVIPARKSTPKDDTTAKLEICNSGNATLEFGTREITTLDNATLEITILETEKTLDL